MSDREKYLNDMDNIMKAFNGEEKVSISQNNDTQPNDAIKNDPLNSVPGMISEQEINMMEKLINATDETKVENITKKTVEQGENNKELYEALHTQKTDDGVRVGSWKIEQNIIENSNKKIFNVIHVDTHEPIAKDLMLYEAAYALVKMFNKGYTITDGKVQEIVNLEERFSTSYSDASQFKKKSKQCFNKGNYNKGNMFEARFDKSRSSALKIKETIKNKLNNI